MEATIQVNKKYPPDAGKKRWKVEDPAGVRYQVDPHLAVMLNQGYTYQISYRVDSFNGRNYNVIDNVLNPGMGTATQQVQAPPPPQQQYQQPQLPVGQSVIQPPLRDPFKDEDIAVLAIIKSMQIPLGDAETVRHALVSAAQGWRLFKQWQRQPQQQQAPAPTPGTGQAPYHSMKDYAHEPGFDDDPNFV